MEFHASLYAEESETMSKLSKLYVWKLGKEKYFANYSNFPSIIGNWGRLVEWETEDLFRAKTWKTVKGAERILMTNIEYEEFTLKNATDVYNLTTDSYQKSRSKQTMDRASKQLAVLKQVTVTEVEIDSEAKAKPRIAFEEGSYKGFSSNEKCVSNSYCRICGMKLRGLPYFTVGAGYRKSLNVCPCCILERAQDAELMLSKLPEDLRKELEAERFLHNMG